MNMKSMHPKFLLLTELMFYLLVSSISAAPSNEKNEPADDTTQAPTAENNEDPTGDYVGATAPGRNEESTEDYGTEYFLASNRHSEDAPVDLQKRAAPSMSSSFLRLGKSGPMKSSSFIRFGRSPSFLRFGRSGALPIEAAADYDATEDPEMVTQSGYYFGVPSAAGMERPRFLYYDQKPLKAYRRAQSSFIRFGKRSGAPIANDNGSDGAIAREQPANWQDEDDASYPTSSGLIDTDDNEATKVEEKRGYDNGDRHTSSFLRFGRGSQDDSESDSSADYFDKEQKRGTSSFIRFGKRDKQEQLRELQQRLLHAQMLQQRQRQQEKSQDDVSYALPYGGLGSNGSLEGGRPRRNMLYFTRLPASKRLLARNFIRLGKRSVSVEKEESSHGGAHHHHHQARH